MYKPDLATMQVEDLWQLYEDLARALAERLTVEKRGLEDRLARLTPVEAVRQVGTSPPLSLSLTDRASRRKFSKAPAKYRNPLAPSQKWSGRGRRPTWVLAALAAGQGLDELEIEHAGKRDRNE
jgi:DNA-binding protein H-NS